jgi:hypothetical protein
MTTQLDCNTNRPARTAELQREFLGWDRPALESVAEFLLNRYTRGGVADLQQVVVATAGARAGRRLLERLVEQAEVRKTRLVPPRITTFGRLPELLYVPPRPPAEEIARQLAWREALQGMASEQLSNSFGPLPSRNDLLRWLTVGEMLDRLHTELAGECWTFEQVLRHCSQEESGFADAQRWGVLTQLYPKYLTALEAAGLCDLQQARLDALANDEPSSDVDLVLVAAADLNQLTRQMLQRVGGRVTSLVYGGEELADAFDADGCLLVEAWAERTIDLVGRIEVVDRPGDQAQRVVDILASRQEEFPIEDITIGLLDESLLPTVRHGLSSRGVEARFSVGTPLVEAAPCVVLMLAARLLESRQFSDFATLVRHPDVERYLRHAIRESPGEDFDRWLEDLDGYAEKHLPAAVPERWLGNRERAARLESLRLRVKALLTPLQASRKTLAEWPAAILEVILNLYGWQPLSRGEPGERELLDSLQQLQSLLATWHDLQGMAPRATVREALQLLLRQAGRAAIAAEAGAEAIEMLGWLELPLDDAPLLIAVGFNEGAVPSSVNHDPFLPNRLRRRLKLLDNERRLARDAYALSTLAATRDLMLIAGRRDGEGNPLYPSRLQLTGEPAAVAGRILRFFGGESGGSQAPNAHGESVGRTRFSFPVPKPKPPLTSLSVTAFRDYLTCPYRFYLKHVLGLRAIESEYLELDAPGFGTLAHDVLNELAQGPIASSTSEEQIGRHLSDTLNRLAGMRFGSEPLPPVLVQVEQLRLRLAGLAKWQATRNFEGWRIMHTELSFEDAKVTLEVDGEPFFITGRIDRIDWHAETGMWQILDFKTSEKGRSPEKTHRDGTGWIDLQLPLYRRLAASCGITGVVEMAYVVLPESAEVELLAASWTNEELIEAEEKAREVVRALRTETFWPPRDLKAPLFAEFAPLCLDPQWNTCVPEEESEEAT